MPTRKKTAQSTVIPFSKGFRPPSIATRKSALGKEENSILYSFEDFKPIPKCTSQDDWLAQYKEEGQTVSRFILENPWFSRRKRMYIRQKFVADGEDINAKYPEGKIYLLPVGNLDFDVDNMAKFAEAYLGIKFGVLPELETGVTNKTVWMKRGNKKVPVQGRVADNGRFQINITAFLAEVKHQLQLNTDGLCVIGLTKYELYESRSDLFVAGMASGNQRIAGFSLLRYDPNLAFSSEFWHKVESVADPLPGKEAARLVFERSLKLLVHETMHLLGLDHCIYFECVMNGAGHLAEDYRQPMFLCPVCLKKMWLTAKFDIRGRYRTLTGLYGEFGMEKEVTWIENRFKVIGNSESGIVTV